MKRKRTQSRQTKSDQTQTTQNQSYQQQNLSNVKKKRRTGNKKQTQQQRKLRQVVYPQQKMRQQQQTQQQRKSMIVNKFLALNTLPEQIKFKSLRSMTYFENYKGQNDEAPGKNILNIGESHYTSDSGFESFLNFLENLVKKNLFLNGCLDFVFENFVSRIPHVPYVQDQIQNQNDGKIFTKKHSSGIATLDYLRNQLDTQNFYLAKGFRVHFTETRQDFKGFYTSIILLLQTLFKFGNRSVRYRLTRDFFVKIAVYIYELYDEKYITEYYKKENIEKEIWKLFILIRDIGDDVFFSTLTQKLEEAKNLQSKKYYEGWIWISKTKDQELVAFVNSVLNYIKDILRYKSINDIKLDDDFTKCNRNGYYTYLVTKKNRSEIENTILKYESYDKKFKKQLNKIDETYFLDDPKKFIFMYFFTQKNVTPNVFYDIQTVCRIFRKFDESKKRFKSCDDQNKSMKNIIIYSGNSHTNEINNFLKALYSSRLKPRQYIPFFILGLKYHFDDSGKDIDNDHHQVIPTNIDYFQYNEKIIKQLKQKYDVKQYTQLNKIKDDNEIDEEQTCEMRSEKI